MAKKTLKGATELSTEIYNDVLAPSAKIIGKVTADAIKTVLSPLRAFIWGWNEIEQWLAKKVVKKLERCPSEKIVVPDPLIAGPIIENMRFASKHEYLQDLYAELLAKAMNEDTKDSVLPVFVEMIKQFSPLDATIFKNMFFDLEPAVFAAVVGEETMIGYSYIYRINGYNLTAIEASVDNLFRMSLIEIVFSNEFHGKQPHERDWKEKYTANASEFLNTLNIPKPAKATTVFHVRLKPLGVELGNLLFENDMDENAEKRFPWREQKKCYLDL